MSTPSLAAEAAARLPRLKPHRDPLNGARSRRFSGSSRAVTLVTSSGAIASVTSSPPGYRLVRMSAILTTDVIHDESEGARAHRCDTVALGPAQVMQIRGGPAIDHARSASLQPLQESGQRCGRVNRKEKVDMGRHDSQCQHPASLVVRDQWQLLCELHCAIVVETRCPITGGPDNVHNESMVHPEERARIARRTVPNERTSRPLHDIAAEAAARLPRLKPHRDPLNGESSRRFSGSGRAVTLVTSSGAIASVTSSGAIASATSAQ